MVDADSSFVRRAAEALECDWMVCPSWLRRSETFAERLSLVSDRLLFCESSGYSDVDNVEDQRRMLDDILNSRDVREEGYVLVSDWKHLSGSSRAARRAWVSSMAEDRRLLGLIFFNVSHFFRMNIKIGRRFNIVRFPVEIARDEEDAVARAVAMLSANPKMSRPERASLPPSIPPSPPEVGDAVLLMEVLAKINWNEPGLDIFDDIPGEHRLKPLFEALSMIKLEVDGVLKERQQREEELERARNAAFEADKAKSAFLANMSHEIRTPMNGIMGCTGFLESSALNGDQSEWVKTIRDSGVQLLGIIDNLLDLAKIEAGDLRAEPVRFRLRETLEEVRRILAPGAKAKGLVLETVVEEGLPDRLKGDRGQLVQVLLNLAGNGIKFTEEGSVELSVGAREDTGEKVRLVFEVKDTGPGIPEHSVPHIFDSFYQVDGGFSRKHEGTGLGLTICKRLAEIMGGELELASTGSGGSVFRFTAELEVIEKRRSTSMDAPPATSREKRARPREGVKLLLVEDNLVNQKVAMKILSNLGYQADLARDGIEAIDVLENAAYDLVLMDLQMPRMSGFEATEQIRRGAGKIVDPRVPIVALTANAMKGDREKCLEAGMNDHIAKPIDPAVLADVLARHLGTG